MKMIFKPVITGMSATSWPDNWFWSHCWTTAFPLYEYDWSYNWFLHESASRHWATDIFESDWV